jgi:hypothetical protein
MCHKAGIEVEHSLGPGRNVAQALKERLESFEITGFRDEGDALLAAWCRNQRVIEQRRIFIEHLPALSRSNSRKGASALDESGGRRCEYATAALKRKPSMKMFVSSAYFTLSADPRPPPRHRRFGERPRTLSRALHGDLRHTSAFIPMRLASDDDDAIVVEGLSNEGGLRLMRQQHSGF